jgi:enolase-phosphatase E1
VFVPDESLIRVVLLDIEGTTTPIDFVYKTLFPYASGKLESFLGEHWRDPEIGALVQDLHAQQQLDERQALEPPVWMNESEDARMRSAMGYARWLMGKDSKCTALKSLQGKIWQEGYGSGKLHGEVYADVPRAFERWRGQGRDIAIYSSGSILAQQLLFRTATPVDLTSEIAGFFDTRVGVKSDGESYKRIAASLGRTPREFLFVSDAAKEIEAAQSAEMNGVLCVRDALASAPPAAGTIIRSFDEIFPD